MTVCVTIWLAKLGDRLESSTLRRQHDVRTHHQRPRDRDPLLLASDRRLGRRHLVGQADPCQEIAREPLGLPPVEAEQFARRESEVLQHCQMGKQVELLEHPCRCRRRIR